MGNFLSKIAQNGHWIIIAFALYGAYEVYTLHIENLERLKAESVLLDPKIQDLKTQTDQVDKYYADVDDARRRIEIAAQEVERLQQQLPQKNNDAEDLDLISTTAKNLNLKDVSISPKEEQDKGFYFVKRYEFKASGTYLQFLIFLEKMGQTKRLFNISDLYVWLAGTPQRGRFQMIGAAIYIETFRYNPLYKEDRGIEKIKKEIQGEKQ